MKKNQNHRQPVALGQKTGQIEAARRRLGSVGTFSFGGSQFGSVQRSGISGFGFGNLVTDGLVAGDVIAGPPARGAWRQAGTGDDDCARAAHVGGG